MAEKVPEYVVFEERVEGGKLLFRKIGSDKKVVGVHVTQMMYGPSSRDAEVFINKKQAARLIKELQDHFGL